MQWLHPAVLAVGLTVWLIIGLLLWQLHRERTVTAQAKAELRIYIQASAENYQKAIDAEGRLSQCMAQF